MTVPAVKIPWAGSWPGVNTRNDANHKTPLPSAVVYIINTVYISLSVLTGSFDMHHEHEHEEMSSVRQNCHV